MLLLLPSPTPHAVIVQLVRLGGGVALVAGDGRTFPLEVLPAGAEVSRCSPADLEVLEAAGWWIETGDLGGRLVRTLAD